MGKNGDVKACTGQCNAVKSYFEIKNNNNKSIFLTDISQMPVIFYQKKSLKFIY